jgi:hypothetical protein
MRARSRTATLAARLGQPERALLLRRLRFDALARFHQARHQLVNAVRVELDGHGPIRCVRNRQHAVLRAQLQDAARQRAHQS